MFSLKRSFKKLRKDGTTFFMVATSSPKRIVNASGDMYDWSFEKQGEETKNAKYGCMSKAGAKRFRRLIPKT